MLITSLLNAGANKSYVQFEPMGEIFLRKMIKKSNFNENSTSLVTVNCGILPILDQEGFIDRKWFDTFQLEKNYEDHLFVSTDSKLVNIDIPICYAFTLKQILFLKEGDNSNEEASTISEVSFGTSALSSGKSIKFSLRNKNGFRMKFSTKLEDPEKVLAV
jgi:hypothetical protein